MATMLICEVRAAPTAFLAYRRSIQKFCDYQVFEKYATL